jgi:hypothetical protein
VSAAVMRMDLAELPAMMFRNSAHGGLNTALDIGAVSVTGPLSLASGKPLHVKTIAFSGTVTCVGANAIEVDGGGASAWNCTGTFTKATSVITFSDSTTTVTTNGQSFYSVMFNTGPDNYTISGAFAFSGTVTGNNNVLACDSDWTNTGTFTCGTSSVQFNGSVAQTVTTGGDTFYNLAINNSHGSDKVIISGALDVNGAFALQKGILDIGTNDPAVNTAGNVIWTLGCTIFTDDRTATWTFDGTTTYTDSNTTVQDIDNTSVTGTLTLGSDIHMGTFSIGSGDTFTAGTYDVKIDGATCEITNTGNWTGTGTVTFITTSCSYTDHNSTPENIGNLTTAAGAASPSLTITKKIHFVNLTIGSGTTLVGQALSSTTMYCDGDWANSGTFNHGSGTVIMEGDGFDITGMNGSTNKFYNLTINDDTTTNTMVSYGSIQPFGGCLTKDQANSLQTLNIDNVLTVNGTFHVAANSGGTECA